jgi:hypothetical protein
MTNIRFLKMLGAWALLALLFAAPPGARADFTLVDGNASAFLDTSGDRNVTELSAAGTDNLFANQWFYRVNGDAQEFDLGAPDSEDPSSNSAALIWGDVGGRGLFSAQEVVALNETTPNVTATLTLDLTITNISGSTLTIDFFSYTDYDVRGSGNDTIFALGGDTNRLLYVDGDSQDSGAHESSGLAPDAFEVAAHPSITNALTDGSITNFVGGSFPFGPADASSGFQWSLTIPASGNQALQVVLGGNTAPLMGVDDSSAIEGDAGTTALIFNVSVSPPSPNALSVNFATVAGTAEDENGSGDYTSVSGTLNFAPLQASNTITVLINGDTTLEAAESFEVQLSGLSGDSNALLSNALALGTIRNDEEVPGAFYATEAFGNPPSVGLVDSCGSVVGVPITADTGDVVFQTNGLARHPGTGEFYALVFAATTRGGGSTQRFLAQLDVNTGLATIIGDTGDSFADLTFHSDGTLYAVTGDGATTPSSLFTLSLADATPTFVLDMGPADFEGEGIAFNPEDGFIYRVSGLDQLDVIDLSGPPAIINSISLTSDGLGATRGFGGRKEGLGKGGRKPAD